MNRQARTNLNRDFTLFLPAAVLAAFFCSCAAGSKSKIPDLSKISPVEIQEKVERNLNKLKSFEGRARVVIELPGEGYSGTSQILVNFPDSVFVKTEAILGIDIGALFMDENLFAAYAPRDNVLYYGKTETLDLRDFLQIEIETNELVENLTGLTQVWIDSNPKLTWDDGKYLITANRWLGQAKYWIDSKKFIVTRSELRDHMGDVVLEKKYERIKTKKGIVLPRTIRITRPKAKERLTVYYTSQELNEPINPERFRLKPAANAKRVFWEAVLKGRANEMPDQSPAGVESDK